MGMQVYEDDPTQRGFRQPCPLWKGVCTIHDSPHYPRSCRAYQCKLLKDVLRENTPLPEALARVEQVKGMIAEIKAILPASTNTIFRERLATHVEQPPEGTATEKPYQEFREKADALLRFIETHFGVTGIIEP